MVFYGGQFGQEAGSYGPKGQMIADMYGDSPGFDKYTQGAVSSFGAPSDGGSGAGGDVQPILSDAGQVSPGGGFGTPDKGMSTGGRLASSAGGGLTGAYAGAAVGTAAATYTAASAGLTGAALSGAVAGSVVPVVGTVVGAALGALAAWYATG